MALDLSWIASRIPLSKSKLKEVLQAVSDFIDSGAEPDHGLLDGLNDDDHVQYYNTTRLNTRFGGNRNVTSATADVSTNTSTTWYKKFVRIDNLLADRIITFPPAANAAAGFPAGLFCWLSVSSNAFNVSVTVENTDELRSQNSFPGWDASLDTVFLGLSTAAADEVIFEVHRIGSLWVLVGPVRALATDNIEHGTGEGGGGVTDHGALSGLGDDDHTQYLNDARGDLRYYTQTQLDIALALKSDTSHLHDDRYYTETEIDAMGGIAVGDLVRLGDIGGGVAGLPAVDGSQLTGLAGGGDMVAATYDPTAVADDAFDMENMAEGATNKIFTATERTKLTGIEDNATADQTGAEIKALYEAQDNAAYLRALRGDRSGFDLLNDPVANAGTLDLTHAIADIFGNPTGNVTLTVPNGSVIDEKLEIVASGSWGSHVIALHDEAAQVIKSAIKPNIIYELRWRGTGVNPRWQVEGFRPKSTGNTNQVVLGTGELGLALTPTGATLGNGGIIAVGVHEEVDDGKYRTVRVRHATDPTQPVALTLEDGFTQWSTIKIQAALDQTGKITITRETSGTINGGTSISLKAEGGATCYIIFHNTSEATAVGDLDVQLGTFRVGQVFDNDARTVTTGDSGKTLIYAGAGHTWTFTSSGLQAGDHGVIRNIGTGPITISTDAVEKFTGTEPIPAGANAVWEYDGTNLYLDATE